MPQFLFWASKRCKWSILPVRYRGALILSIPAVCTFAILSMWIWSREDAIAVHENIDRSESTIMTTNNILALITSAETGIHGYLVTQKTDFLEPYDRALIDLEPSLVKLENLQKNTSQQADVLQITRLVRQQMSLLKQTQEQTSQPPLNSVKVNDLFARSKTNIAAIEVNAKALRTEQWQQLNAYRQQLFDVRKTTNVLLWTLAIVSLLSFLAALYLFFLLDRELENRQMQLQARAGELASLNHTLVQMNDTLAERNRDLDDFSHIVSHDLKAPLRAISNLSVWIEEDLADKLTPENRKQMSLLRERVGRMENMIEGLLQYARWGRQTDSLELVDVRQLLAETIDSLEPPPEFDFAIDGSMPTIETQRLLLAQVFANLISNAIKHHHRSQGKIVISVRELENFYEFAVSDDGPGIAPEAQTRIFDLFQTLGKQKNRQNTGIGLATVKKIVEERGGKIEVESQLGRGTTFRFLWTI